MEETYLTLPIERLAVDDIDLVNNSFISMCQGIPLFDNWPIPGCPCYIYGISGRRSYVDRLRKTISGDSGQWLPRVVLYHHCDRRQATGLWNWWLAAVYSDRNTHHLLIVYTFLQNCYSFGTGCSYWARQCHPHWPTGVYHWTAELEWWNTNLCAESVQCGSKWDHRRRPEPDQSNRKRSGYWWYCWVR